MISILPTNETTPEMNCPVVKRTRVTAKTLEEYSVETHSPAPIIGEFDLFGEARRIYARARSQRRVRSSNII